jgi:predicted metal-dependent phosphotriesterase family hydrolase
VATRRYRRRVPTIETASGPVDSFELGRVLMYEHVFLISPEMQNNVPEEWATRNRAWMKPPRVCSS